MTAPSLAAGVLLLEGMPWSLLVWFLLGGVAAGIWRAGAGRR